MSAAFEARSSFQELGLFVIAVLFGSLSGLATTLLLGANAGLAVATTCTGAAHSHFVHKQPWLRLVPKIGVGAPLAYGVMRVVHVLLGA